MPDVIAEVTTEILQAFADAWNRHDVDALMSFMTEDCVFEASAGPDVCGRGTQAVRPCELASEVWATFPDAHWGNARHFVCGDARDVGVDVHGNTRTARASKSMVVICSHFETARLP